MRRMSVRMGMDARGGARESDLCDLTSVNVLILASFANKHHTAQGADGIWICGGAKVKG